MKIFTIILGIRLPILMKLVLRNGITPFPIYLLRFLFLLQGALFSSALTLVEKIKFGGKIRETELKKAPIFIIGHWRTGSTFLHQLFNLDPQFTTPTMVQTAIPDHFLFSSKYYVPILKRAMPATRPMDNMPLSPGEPQEEEFALIRMGSESPIENLIFPSGKGYFLNNYSYIPQGRKLEVWKRNLLTFFHKITVETGKQIVSKNPYHTMRLELLAEMFPNARFIHITRDPMTVVPSTIRMWTIVARENKLKKGWKEPTIEEVASVLHDYQKNVAAWKNELGTRLTEIQFEDLEKEPMKQMKRLYADLGLTFSDTFETRVGQFLETNKNYVKNSYISSRTEMNTIQSVVGEYK